MSTLNYVRHFRELEVYKKQRVLAKEVFGLTKLFPREEQYSMTDQLRRSARSIGAQIAEAWAKRLYPKHFVSKLTDADGEQMETQHWLLEAIDCAYVDNATANRLLGLCEEIGRMLGSMMRKADAFASGDYVLHEEQSTFGPPPES
ncbi:MAG: four helix bundle protein [Opitutus sp.]|nr:four helix bundle protein [Opitutus sp.]